MAAPPSIACSGDVVDVKDKVAIITGASRGIGEATARHLGANGIKVVLAARGVDKCQAIADEIVKAGGVASAVKCDVKIEADIEAAFKHAADTYGGVDFVFANAGVEGDDMTEIDECDINGAKHIWDVNIMGVWCTLKHATKALKARGGGAFVATSSIAAIVPRDLMQAFPMSTFSAYGMSKAAVDSLIRQSGSLLPHKIRCYGISPAVYSTQMVENIVKFDAVKGVGATTPDAFAGFNPLHVGKSGDPKCIGAVVLSLFDNSTKYSPCSHIVCDNEHTFDAHNLYNSAEQPGGWQVPDACVNDAQGNSANYTTPKAE